MIWTVFGILASVAALVFCFIPRGFAALLAFAAMVALRMGGVAAVSTEQLWFWGAAALIVLGISVLLPAPVATSRRGVAYIVTATLAGLMLGLLISPNVMVLGGVTGAFCGAMAYSFTPAGRKLQFPSRHFVNYLCAKALPPVITLSILAITFTLMMATPHNNYLM